MSPAHNMDIEMDSPPSSPQPSGSKRKLAPTSDSPPKKSARKTKAKTITKPAAKATSASLAVLVENLARSQLTINRLQSEQTIKQKELTSAQKELEVAIKARVEAEETFVETKTRCAVQLQDARSHTIMLEMKLAQLVREQHNPPPSPTRQPLAPRSYSTNQIFATGATTPFASSASSTSSFLTAGVSNRSDSRSKSNTFATATSSAAFGLGSRFPKV
ncbi:hypothetical protein C8R45DRAFT_1210211 [Mycena sanguinolenta]|nr:hypothetical protein C8R45DRAFT_1210211 [Mycena sanguinolenta]